MLKRISKSDIDDLSYDIVGAAIEVHRILGPGLLESIYEECLMHELELRGIPAQRQVALPLSYKGLQFEKKFYIDILVNGLIVVELKAVERMAPVHRAQLISYLQLSNMPKGLLINFNATTIKADLIGYVGEAYDDLPDE